MPAAHRHGDLRSCGATTVATGQTTVKIGGQLWAVQNDQNNHGNGGLIASGTTVKIGGKAVIAVGDTANPDTLCFTIGGPHCNPSATSGAGTVSCY
jgi:uncharacterized Zn-binding protein involved in type VI secretion